MVADWVTTTINRGRSSDGQLMRLRGRTEPRTPSPTSTAILHPSNSTEPCSVWYTVQPGEYCSVVANRYNLTLAELRAHNPSLDDECSLAIGQVLCVATAASPAGLSHAGMIGVVVIAVLVGVALLSFALFGWCRSRHHGEVRLFCEVCKRKRSDAKFPIQITPRCTHDRVVCSSCLSKWILKRAADAEGEQFAIVCPARGCEEELSLQDLKTHLSPEDFRGLWVE